MEGVLSKGVLSGNGLCLEGVMYGGGFVRGFFLSEGVLSEGVLSKGVLSGGGFVRAPSHPILYILPVSMALSAVLLNYRQWSTAASVQQASLSL